MHTILKGKTKEVVIGIDRPFVMIGEKINPTGRKKLAAALTEGNFDYIRQLVENQIAWGQRYWISMSECRDWTRYRSSRKLLIWSQHSQIFHSVSTQAIQPCWLLVWRLLRENRWSTRSVGNKNAWRLFYQL